VKEKANGEDKKADAENTAEKQKKDRLKDSRTERGIATMFRIMSANHMELSQMADSKANIMISVNTIVLSIMVSVLFNKLQFILNLLFPVLSWLLFVCRQLFLPYLLRAQMLTGELLCQKIFSRKK
jgi:hypothetical protein